MGIGSTHQKANIVRKTQTLEEITLAIFRILCQTYLQEPIQLTGQGSLGGKSGKGLFLNMTTLVKKRS